MGKTVYNSKCSGSDLADYCRGFMLRICEIPGDASHFSKVSTEANEQCQSVLSRIKQEKKIKKKIAVYQNPGITIPCAEGVFRWNIYLPDYDYSEEELYYALLHECTHFTNGDLYIKWLTQLCRCLCWWNPLVYKMQDTLEKNLEIRCDLTVTEKLSQKEQLSYLGTIVKTLKKCTEKKRQRCFVRSPSGR